MAGEFEQPSRLTDANGFVKGATKVLAFIEECQRTEPINNEEAKEYWAGIRAQMSFIIEESE